MVEALKPYLANVKATTLTNLFWTNLSFEKPTNVPTFETEKTKNFKSYKIDWIDDWRTGLLTLKSAERFNYAKINENYYFLDVDKYLGRDPNRLIRYRVTWDVWVNDVLGKDLEIKGCLAKSLDLELVYRERANVTPITQGCNAVRYLPLKPRLGGRENFYTAPKELERDYIKESWWDYKVTENFKTELNKVLTNYLNKQDEHKGKFFIKGVQLPKIKKWQYAIMSEIHSMFSSPQIQYRVIDVGIDNDMSIFLSAFKKEFPTAEANGLKLYSIARKGASLQLFKGRFVANHLKEVDLSGLTDILSLSPITQLAGQETDTGEFTHFLGEWKKEEIPDNEFTYLFDIDTKSTVP